MNNDLKIKFPNGNEDLICCAHCGSTHGYHSYNRCQCPGHIKTLLTHFIEMSNLAERLEEFENWLEEEECQNDGHCKYLSNTERMCVVCRLQLHFFHTIYNWDAYEH